MVRDGLSDVNVCNAQVTYTSALYILTLSLSMYIYVVTVGD
jgi:hypothetical protein